MGLLTGDGITQVLYPLLLTLTLWIGAWGVRWALQRGELRPAMENTEKKPTTPLLYALLSVPLLLAFMAWWLTTPDPTLVNSLFWLLPILQAYKLRVTLQGIEWRTPRLRRWVTPTIFLLVNTALLITLLLNGAQAIQVLPGFAPLPTPLVVEESLPRRLRVWVTVDGNACWNTQLPCAPYADPQLRRRGNDLQHGFRLLSPFNTLFAQHNPSSTLCQPLPFVLTQPLNFAWVACGKQKG